MRIQCAGFYRTLLAVTTALVVTGNAAGSAETDFNQANQLYEKGQYGPAALAYKKIADAGPVSPALLFNEGNAWFKAGKVGLAITAYRQAENLDPRNPDIKANLRFARDQVKDSHLSQKPRWLRWVSFLSLNEWSVLFSISSAGWFVLLGLRKWKGSLKNTFSGYTASLGLLSLGLAAALGLAVQQRLVGKTSVVILPEAVIRRGPYEESQSYFTATDGTEFVVLEERGDWVEVMDGSQRIGWVPRKELNIIRGGA